MKLPDNFKNVVIGSYFGDGTIAKHNPYSKHHFLKISHGMPQYEYCKWKSSLFGEFLAGEPYIINRTFKDKPYQCCTFATKVHPFCDQLRDYYIDGQKHIKKWMFHYMTPEAIAIWYMDDGDFQRASQKRKDGARYRKFIGCRLSLGIWPENECNLVREFFLEKYNIEPKIYLESGKYRRAWFNVEKSKIFLDIVRPHMPECMNYKLGLQHEAIEDNSIDDIV
jgi:recombination protein RecA